MTIMTAVAENSLEVSNFSLVLSTLLLFIAFSIDYKEGIGLGKDIIIAGVRAVIQLFLVGFVLSYVFKVDNNFLTLAMVLLVIFNASYNAHTSSEGIPNSFMVSLLSIGIGTTIALSIMVFSGVIDWTPMQIIPITGMVASNSMTAINVVYRSLRTQFKDRRQEVLEKIALGATPKQASNSILRDSIRTGMTPPIERTKTVGLVSLPGMMTGLIVSGIDPSEAIRYQIVVMFMLISVAAISSFIASYMVYRSFYNENAQLTI